jgi:flagellar basal body-associated protein FliL
MCGLAGDFMADDKKEEKQETTGQASTEAKSPAEKETPAKGKKLFVWLVLAIVVLAGGVGGFTLSVMMGGSSSPEPNITEAAPVEETFDPLLAKTDTQKSWLYAKMDSIVANLDEPGVTRYVRVSIILELSPKLDSINGDIFLDEKKILLQDWMTTYLAGLSLEDVRGSRNLNRIKREVLEQFNKLLFGPDKPYVQKVLFKEFAVQ